MIVELIRGLGLGGAETLLVNRLAAARDLGLLSSRRVIVFNTYPPARHYVSALESLQVQVVSSDPGRLRGMMATFRIVLSAADDDSVVVHSPSLALAAKIAKRLGAKCRVVEVVHSTAYAWPYSVFARLLNSAADMMVAVSSDVAISSYMRGARSHRVVYGGVPVREMASWIESEASAEALALRSSIGLAEDTPLVVAVGSLIGLKGHATLIEALASPRLQSAHAVIVGEGAERRHLESLALSRQVSDRVHLVGRRERAWRWLAVADVQCHPSFYEGLPVALMEGGALGVPIVASDINGTRDFESRTPDVTLVPAGDVEALAAALADRLDAVDRWSVRLGKTNIGATFWAIERYVKEFYAALEAPERSDSDV